ncbi:hypothetical protein C4D27_16125 [Clostridium perfringens]
MKKYKIENILHSKGYVSIETLIVAGLVIATGAFLISKLVWKGKDIAMSNDNNMATVGKTMDDNLFNGNDVNKTNESSTNLVEKSKEVDCSLIENPSNLNEFKYKDISIDGVQGISITGYTGDSSDVVIPSCINGKPVVEIGPCAFVGRNATNSGDKATIKKPLTSVIIPDTVLSIQSGAFFNNDIKTIKLPKNLRYVEYRAFQSAGIKGELELPKELRELAYEAFKDNDINKVVINNLGTVYASYQLSASGYVGDVFLGNSIEDVVINDKIPDKLFQEMNYDKTIFSAIIPNEKPYGTAKDLFAHIGCKQKLLDYFKNIKFVSVNSIIKECDGYKYFVVDDNVINSMPRDVRPSEGINYYDNILKTLKANKGSAVIIGYDGKEENIRIPKIVDGKRVVCILSLDSRIDIKSIEIPDSVECIDDNAFFNLISTIEKVSMPKKFENDKKRLFEYKADKIQFKII